MGLSALGARATATAAVRLTNVAVPDEATLGRQPATRAPIGVGGTALASLPERDGERLWVASSGLPVGCCAPAPLAGSSTT
jgi:alkylation response protein AidB-like acyl-CoA dehydrogenase